MYSFDLRSSSGQHWRDTNSLGERGYVFYEETPHACRSSLNLEPVEGRDGGRYRCRVDYRVSPTRNTRIKLKLVARPGLPTISTEAGVELASHTPPHPPGQDLRLHCQVGGGVVRAGVYRAVLQVRGGEPTPTLSWRLAGSPVQPVSHSVDSVAGTVRSTVVVPDLSPAHQGAELSCTAANSDLVPAQTTAVSLQLLLPPVRAKAAVTIIILSQ